MEVRVSRRLMIIPVWSKTDDLGGYAEEAKNSLMFDNDETIFSQLGTDIAVHKQNETPFVFARSLKNLAVGPHGTPHNCATKAYINNLPDELKVVLVWY